MVLRAGEENAGGGGARGGEAAKPLSFCAWRVIPCFRHPVEIPMAVEGRSREAESFAMSYGDDGRHRGSNNAKEWFGGHVRVSREATL